MENKTKYNKVHIWGSGGIGFWLTVGLVRSDIKPLIVYDDDDLQGGLGHARLPAASAITKKINLLRGFLRVSMGDDIPTFIDKRATGREVSEGDLVIDCSDMPLTDRQKVWRAAQKRGARCLRVSYDGANSIIVFAEGLPLIGSPTGGYSSVPSLALSLAAGGIGAECIRLLTDEHVEFQINLSELVTHKKPK